jgi:hypothetical protein
MQPVLLFAKPTFTAPGTDASFLGMTRQRQYRSRQIDDGRKDGGKTLNRIT